MLVNVSYSVFSRRYLSNLILLVANHYPQLSVHSYYLFRLRAIRYEYGGFLSMENRCELSRHLDFY